MTEKRSVMDMFGVISLELNITIKPPVDPDVEHPELEPDKTIKLRWGGKHLFTAEEEQYIPLMIEHLMKDLYGKVAEGAQTDFL
jgi:hypothetical protein